MVNHKSFQNLLYYKPVRKINPSNPTVRMYLHSQGLHIVCSVSTPCEVSQVELYLVPAVIQSHRHRANKRLYPGGGLKRDELTTLLHIIYFLPDNSKL